MLKLREQGGPSLLGQIAELAGQNVRPRVRELRFARVCLLEECQRLTKTFLSRNELTCQEMLISIVVGEYRESQRIVSVGRAIDHRSDD